MKLIIAYIQPEKLNDVKQSLYAAEVFRLSVTNAMGCGQQKGYQETYRGVDIEVNLLKKVRIEIAVNDDLSETARSSCFPWSSASESGRATLDPRPSADATTTEPTAFTRTRSHAY